MKKPVVLTIIDGLGYNNNKEGNAWASAKTPHIDSLLKNYPNSTLQAAGVAVGLPEGQIGNSEVGHLNIGAGQVVYTGLSLINNSIKDQSFYKNELFLKSIEHAKKNNSTLHLLGLLSGGGVHSMEKHAFALLDLVHKSGLKKVTFHAFGDGRDVAPRSIKPSLEKLLSKLNEYGFKLGSIAGRLYAMDRDTMFEKTEKSYQAMQGKSDVTFTNPLEYIDQQYAKDNSDEFLECAINANDGINFLKNNDALIFYNFRPDRARQLAHLIIGSSLYDYKPSNALSNLQLTTMMKYEGIDEADVAFSSMVVEAPIGKVLSENGLKQLRIAETQKYAHVTFFMDGGKDIELKGADRILVPSLKIDDFSKSPEMSAKKITEELVKVLDKYDVVIMNYANPDMVGHTGNFDATINAVEIIDQEIGKLYDAVKKNNGTMFITADHGNAELMSEKGQIITKHTTNDVPLIVTDSNVKLKDGSLSNIAPSILEYMGIKKPASMSSESILKK